MSNIVTWQGRQYLRRIRFYVAKVTRSATASAQFTATITTDPNADAPFLLSSLHASDTADGKDLTNQEPWLCQIRDNQASYQWSETPTPRDAMFGDRITGGILPVEVPILGNTQISITVQNAAANMTAGDAYLTLRGFQLMPLK